MPEGPPLATVAEFADYLQVDAADVERGGDDLLARASSLVRNRGLDQRVDLVEDDVDELYGEGSAVLLLPELPAHEVTSVRLESSPGVLASPLTPFTDYRFEKGRDGARAILRRRGGVWPRGELVVVTYTHGYRLTPAGSGEYDAPLLPETIRLVVCRVAARGIYNPGSLVQQSAGRVVQQFGFDSSRVATLSDADLADLGPWRAR